MYVPGLDLAVQHWWSRWVLRGRKPRVEFATAEAGWALTYTARYRATAIVTFTGVSALYGFAWLDGEIFKTETIGNIGLIAGSIGVWLLFAGFFVTAHIERVVVTPACLRRRSWRGRQEILWSAASGVRVDQENKDIKIFSTSGTVIEVSLFLDGLSAVTDAVQQHLRMTIDLSDAAVRCV